MNELCAAYSRFLNEATLDVFDGLAACSLLGSELTNRLLQVANMIVKLRIERRSEAIIMCWTRFKTRCSGEKDANINFYFS